MSREVVGTGRVDRVRSLSEQDLSVSTGPPGPLVPWDLPTTLVSSLDSTPVPVIVNGC